MLMLEIRMARLKLAVYEKPYEFTTISPGIALAIGATVRPAPRSCASPPAAAASPTMPVASARTCRHRLR